MFTLALFALPPVHESPAGIMCVTFLLIICVVTVQVPNQMRIKMIADQYAPEQMGRITGASRVCFAAGQTLSPVMCAVLYTVHPVACHRQHVPRRRGRAGGVRRDGTDVLPGPEFGRKRRRGERGPNPKVAARTSTSSTRGTGLTRPRTRRGARASTQGDAVL